MTNKIPRQIFYIWIGSDKIGVKYNKFLESNKKYQKGFKCEVWYEDKIINLIKTDYIQYLDTYNNFKETVKKVDFAKYIILYHLGGIYIDLDVELIKPLNDLLNEHLDCDIIVSKLNIKKFESKILCSKDECINNGIIFAKKRLTMFKELIEHISLNTKCSFYLSSEMCILKTTGPGVFSKLCEDFKYKHNIKILDSEVLEPCVRQNCTITAKTVAVHSHVQSYVSTPMAIFFDTYLFVCRFLYLILLFILFIIFLSLFIWKDVKLKKATR